MAKISQNTTTGSAAPHGAPSGSHTQPVISAEMIRIIIHNMVERIECILSIRLRRKIDFHSGNSVFVETGSEAPRRRHGNADFYSVELFHVDNRF